MDYHRAGAKIITQQIATPENPPDGPASNATAAAAELMHEERAKSMAPGPPSRPRVPSPRGTPLLPDLTSLALFLRAVEARSISRAAEQSNIVLSAASRRISQLEERFGTRLLHRGPTGTEPTLAGEELARHVHELLANVSQLCVDMSEFETEAKGRVRLYANPSVMAQQLPQQLVEFGAIYPEIEVEVREHKSTDIARALRESAADIGIITAGVASTEGLHSTLYGPDRMCVVVPKDHVLKGRKVKFRQVLAYDLVCLAGSAPLVRLLTDGAADIGRTGRIPIQVRGFESACRLIQAGLGIGVMSEGAVSIFRRSMALRLIALDEPWAVRRMLLCTLHEQVPASSRRLIAHLRNRHATGEALGRGSRSPAERLAEIRRGACRTANCPGSRNP